MKMVVMSLLRPFINCPQLRVVNDPQPPFLDQEFDIPVNCGLVQRLHRGSADLEDFFNPQRPILLPEDVFNGISLNGLSSHAQAPSGTHYNLPRILLQFFLG